MFVCQIAFEGFAQQSLQPIGNWRDHLPYKSAIDVVAGSGKIYCATPYSLFSINNAENSIERMSKMTGLSETGISAIGYDDSNNKLLIAYSNSMVDIVYRNDVFTISDIFLSTIPGNKTINHVFAKNGKFYLSTEIGIIMIDSEKYEVKDSWFIGNGGSKIKINSVAADSAYFFAATAEGLKKISINNSNPSNYLNWEVVSGANGLSAGVCRNVFVVQNKKFVEKNDSIFMFNGNAWNLFFTETQIKNVHSSSGKIIVSLKNGNNAKVVSLNMDGTVSRLLQNSTWIKNPSKTIFSNNEYWVADSSEGLTKFMNTGIENYKLNSPQSIAMGEMVVKNNTVYVAAGHVNSNWQRQNNKNGIDKYVENKWTNYSEIQYAQMDSVKDITSIAIDPRDETIWGGSFGDGLIHFKKNNSIEIFKQNSTLQSALFDLNSYRIAGIAFDENKNLWVSNYGASKNISVRKEDGSWKAFTPPFFLQENAVAQIVVDDENQKWIVAPKGNGLICFNDANTIDNTNDDRWKLFKFGLGNGNLPSNNVLCLAKDKSGNIWIGTDDGIGIIQCTQQIFSPQGCAIFIPVVKQGGFNSYLFKGEEIKSIAVDGADRKWVATKKGVYLVSADGEKIVYHFTEENSKLLNSDVRNVAINGETGEVFFATAKGICSFRSTASEAKENFENVLVFPNPVLPNFNGTIAIRGLANNAFVKIVEMDGRLVYQTRALGGQVVWDGRDYKGRKISSGIYFVLLLDENGKEKVATKIIFISK